MCSESYEMGNSSGITILSPIPYPSTLTILFSRVILLSDIISSISPKILFELDFFMLLNSSSDISGMG